MRAAGTLDNITIENNYFNVSRPIRFILTSYKNNVIRNNIFDGESGEKAGVDALEVAVTYSSFNSNITNNTIFGYDDMCLDVGFANGSIIDNTVFGCDEGIYVADERTRIWGGSIHDNRIDYLVDYWTGGVPEWTEVRNTNFTTRTIKLEGNERWFNYNNETTGGVWLNTSLNTTSVLEITRKLTSITQTLIQWNDSVTAIAFYRISGLLANTLYFIYDNGIWKDQEMTDASGTLPQFWVDLNSEHEITVANWTIFPKKKRKVKFFTHQHGV